MTYQPFCGCLVVVCLDIFLRVELMVVKEGVVHLFNRICSSDAGTGGGRVNPIPTKGGGGGIFCQLFTSGITKQDTFSELRKREM